MYPFRISVLLFRALTVNPFCSQLSLGFIQSWFSALALEGHYSWHVDTAGPALMETSVSFSFFLFLQITNSGLLIFFPSQALHLIMCAINLPHTVNGVKWKRKCHK